jgi:hypothetical protein
MNEPVDQVVGMVQTSAFRPLTSAARDTICGAQLENTQIKQATMGLL